MAGNEFDINSFGITDTKVVGSYEAAEEFFDFDETSGGGIKTIQEAEKDEEAKKKEALLKKKKPEEAKKEEETKETEEDVIDDPLGELEDKTKKTDEDTSEEDKDEEKKEGEQDKEKENEGNSYEELSKDLFRLGVFTQKDGEAPAKTGEELLARFQEEGQMRATQWLDDFISREGDDRKELFEAIFINGVDPGEYLPVYNQVQNFEGLDLTKEDNQKRVYREFYRRVGLEEDKIEKKLQKTIDYGDLEDEVPDLHEKIITQDKEALQEMTTQKEVQRAAIKKADADYKGGLQKVLSEAVKAKEFKGYPVTDKKAREAFDFLYTPKYKTPNGQLLTEYDKSVLESKKPENLEERILFALLKLDKFDFKNVKNQALSETSKEIFNSLATKVTKDKTRATKSQEKESSAWSSL